jgi:hypothetical protein
MTETQIKDWAVWLNNQAASMAKELDMDWTQAAEETLCTACEDGTVGQADAEAIWELANFHHDNKVA